MSLEYTLPAPASPFKCCHSTLQGFTSYLCSRPCLSGSLQKRLAPCGFGPTRTSPTCLGWELTLASSYNPLRCRQSTLQGLSHSLAARHPVYQGHFRRGFAPRGTGPPSTCSTSSELGVNSGIIIQPSSVLQHHTAGFIAFSLCSLSCTSGPRQTLFAPHTTGSTCPSTTFRPLGVTSGIIVQPSSVLRQYIARSLASHSCLSGPWQMRLAPWALVLRVPALRFLR